jgi:hypothetical protein
MSHVQWLTPVIPGTQEEQIKRIKPVQKVSRTPFSTDKLASVAYTCPSTYAEGITRRTVVPETLFNHS